MKRRVSVLLVVTISGVACADRLPVAPLDDTAPPAAEVSLAKQRAARETVEVLKRLQPVRRESATVTIGPAGGEIALQGSGFLIRVPAGAVATPVAITVNAYGGKAVAYEFGPHGLQFLAPVTIEQTLSGTTAEQSEVLRSLLSAGYLDEGMSAIDDRAGTATISERRPARVSNDNLSVTFEIMHFSGYIIATGRTDSKDAIPPVR